LNGLIGNVIRKWVKHMDVRPWDRYAVGTPQWIEAHRVDYKHGGYTYAVSPADQEALWTDPHWRAEFAKAKHAMIKMDKRMAERSRDMR
jgi:hypothetical protein